VHLPTESDWGDYQDDLDTKYAHDLFAGRTNEEMQVHFRRNPIERTDEFEMDAASAVSLLRPGVSRFRDGKGL
jgi:hypothetical protein